MLQVPANFAAYTVSRAGEAGRNWLQALPALYETMCRRWQLVPDGAPMHGGLSLVVPVKRLGERCVLKLGWVDESTFHEAAALAEWDGRGAVRLLAAEPEEGALLLERLDSSRSLQQIALPDAVRIAGVQLRRLAIPAPPGIPALAVVAERLRQELPQRWEQALRPMSRGVLDRACSVASELGPLSDRLLVNYDLIYADILASQRETWLAIDPKVVAGDLEYGIAQLLWRRLEEMLACGGIARYFDALVDAAELDRDKARAWTIVRCVDYWLWAVGAGLTEDPVRCRTILEWLAPTVS